MGDQEDEEEKEKPDHFYRLICLVVDLGTEVLLKLFLKDIPQGQTVEAFLKSKANVLNPLKNKKVFNDLQIGILNAASPDVSRFDISLLYILISNLNIIQSPIGGWYIACPIPSDPSAGALLMKLRRVRNEAIAHWPRGKMKKSDFEKYWNDTKDILIELAGEVNQAVKDSVKDEIDRTKVKQLVGDMGNKLEALRLWVEQDRNCEKTLFFLEELNKKSSLPEMIYTRPKKRVAGKSDAKKAGAKRVEKSQEDNGNVAPDLEESEYFIAKTNPTMMTDTLNEMMMNWLKGVVLPDTNVKLIVKNCNKDKESEICEYLVKLLNPKIEKDWSKEDKLKINQAVKEAMSELLSGDRELIDVFKSSVNLVIKCPAFENMRDLWMDCMTGKMTRVFKTVEKYLRELTECPALELEVGITHFADKQKNDQHSKVLEDIKSNLQTNSDQPRILTDQIRQIPGTSSETEVPHFDRQSKVLEDIKTHMQTMTDQNRPRPGSSSGKKSQEDSGNFALDLEKSEYFIAKTKLQTEIMNLYKETGCCTTAVTALMDGQDVHIDEIFVMPSMRVSKNMATGRKSKNNMPVSSEVITTIHELYQKDGQPIRRVCISGDAGQGKTTLCKNIVSTWCKVHSNMENLPDTEHQFLKSFDLLFYLPLRNHKTPDVIKMIQTDLLRKASHNALKQVLEEEAEKCLIILDGLDEWLPSEDCKLKVPYIDPKEKFTILMTSRPWKLEVLRPLTSEIGQKVELIGIENDKLIEALVNVFNNRYAKERNWKHFKYTEDTEIDKVTETYKKLEHLGEIPVILTQMVCMWYDDEEVGKTRVEIYSKMLDYLFHVADKRYRETGISSWMRPLRSTNTQLVNVFKGFKYCEMFSEILFKLSDLAYHTLFNEERENSLVFPHSVTEIYKLAENDVKFCHFVGILTQSNFPSKASSHFKSISFLHKTFQEFFAALYIAYGGKDSHATIMLQTLKSLDDVFEMSQVLIFLSALRPDLLGDMSLHIALLTDKDDRVLQYRNSITDEHEDIIVRLQDIIYNCIVEVPEHIMLDTKVELHDVYLQKDDKVKKSIPYLNLENVKSWYQRWDVPSKDWMKLNDLVKLGIRIESREYIDHMTRTVERCASSLTCLSFYIPNLEERFLVNKDNFLTVLKQISRLTCVYLENVNLTHSDIEYLGTTLSQSTQLKEIRLHDIRCRTCQLGQCSYRIDLSHHKQLQYLSIYRLECDIVLSNEVPVECCEIWHVKCAASIQDTLKSSTNLHELTVGSYPTSSITSSTITVPDDEREVHTTTLCVSKVLTDVIPTLKNLRILNLWKIDFKQDILRLSPEMTSLEEVNIYLSTMTLQCLQGFIDSLPQTQFNVLMFLVSICPQEDTSTALKYITDRHQITTEGIPSDMTEDGRLDLSFTNRIFY